MIVLQATASSAICTFCSMIYYLIFDIRYLQGFRDIRSCNGTPKRSSCQYLNLNSFKIILGRDLFSLQANVSCFCSDHRRIRIRLSKPFLHFRYVTSAASAQLQIFLGKKTLVCFAFSFRLMRTNSDAPGWRDGRASNCREEHTGGGTLPNSARCSYARIPRMELSVSWLITSFLPFYSFELAQLGRHRPLLHYAHQTDDHQLQPRIWCLSRWMTQNRPHNRRSNEACAAGKEHEC